MLGNRYGWVPLPYAIAQDEFETILTWLQDNGEHTAALSLLHIYQLDDNYLVPRDLLEVMSW